MAHGVYLTLPHVILHNILTVNCIKTKQYTKYLRQRSFCSKVIIRHADKTWDTHTADWSCSMWTFKAVITTPLSTVLHQNAEAYQSKTGIRLLSIHVLFLLCEWRVLSQLVGELGWLAHTFSMYLVWFLPYHLNNWMGRTISERDIIN